MANTCLQASGPQAGGGNKTAPCAYPWQQLIVDLTGEVVPCCFWSGYGNSGKPLGNTNTETLDEIWNGEAYQDLRAKVASGDLEGHPCGNCMAYRWANETFPRFSWPAGFQKETGYCYTGQIPEQFMKDAEALELPVELIEDGEALTQADAVHDDIRQQGEGRYSVWNGWLYFSSSDNEDPLSSGRRYQMRCGDLLVDLGGLVSDSQSGRNLLTAYGEYNEGREIVKAEPSMITLISTADCNIDCPGCSQNLVRVTKVQHRARTVPDVLEKVPFLSLFIWHGGEPYLIKRFRDFVDEYKTEMNPNLTFGFTSNGMMITAPEAEKLKKFPRLNASVSMDSFQEETFVKIRAGAKYGRVRDNTLRLVDMSDAPIRVFSVGMIICKSNLHELAENLSFALEHDIGLNMSPVVLYPLVEQLNVFADFEAQTAGWSEALDRADALVDEALAANAIATRRVNPKGMIDELRQIYNEARQRYSELVTIDCHVDNPHQSIEKMSNPVIVAYVNSTPVAYVLLEAGQNRLSVVFAKGRVGRLVAPAHQCVAQCHGTSGDTGVCRYNEWAKKARLAGHHAGIFRPQQRAQYRMGELWGNLARWFIHIGSQGNRQNLSRHVQRQLIEYRVEN